MQCISLKEHRERIKLLKIKELNVLIITLFVVLRSSSGDGLLEARSRSV